MTLTHPKEITVVEGLGEFKNRFGLTDEDLQQHLPDDKELNQLHTDEIIDHALTEMEGLYTVNHNYDNGVHTVKRLDTTGLLQIPHRYRDEEGKIDRPQLEDDIANLLSDYNIQHPSFKYGVEDLMEAVINEFIKRVEVIE